MPTRMAISRTPSAAASWPSAMCTKPQQNNLLGDMTYRMSTRLRLVCSKQKNPLCASFAELDEIAACEQSTGRFTASVFQFRYRSAAQHVKRLFDSGALGRAMVAVCNTTWYRDQA